MIDDDDDEIGDFGFLPTDAVERIIACVASAQLVTSPERLASDLARAVETFRSLSVKLPTAAQEREMAKDLHSSLRRASQAIKALHSIDFLEQAGAKYRREVRKDIICKRRDLKRLGLKYQVGDMTRGDYLREDKRMREEISRYRARSDDLKSGVFPSIARLSKEIETLLDVLNHKAEQTNTDVIGFSRWLYRDELTEIYRRNFGREPPYSRGEGGKSYVGPFVRFAQAAVDEMELFRPGANLPKLTADRIVDYVNEYRTLKRVRGKPA